MGKEYETTKELPQNVRPIEQVLKQETEDTGDIRILKGRIK